jgi:cell division septum initiation protein DivIVA
MANDQHPGNGQGRLDRLEGFMALLIDDHVQFQQEHKQLLTAQVVLTDRLDRLAQTVKDIAVAQAEARKITDEKLNALIDIVDDLIRKRPPQAPS